MRYAEKCIKYIRKKKNLICTVLVYVLIFSTAGCGFNFGYESGKFDMQADSMLGMEKMRTGVSRADDGWYYIVEIYENTGENDENQYYFEGINYKYEWEKKMEDTGSSYELVSDNPMTFSMYGEDYRKEIETLNNYLEERQFDGRIKENDLEAIDLELINKSKIIEAYNNAVESEPKSFDEEKQYSGHYVYDTLIEKMSDGTCINVGYYLIKDIELIYIGICYSNGDYLEDLVETGEADSSQMNLYHNINEIAKKILEKKIFDVKAEFENEEWYSDAIIQEIFVQLDKLHSGEFMEKQ